MLKACPRCQELVVDTSGECKKCQKRFAPDRLPPLTKYEASKLLMDRQKERAQVEASNPGSARKGFAWLRYPLMASGWVLAAVSGFLLLNLVLMDLAKDPKVTASVLGITLVAGFLGSAALDKASLPAPLAGGRLAELDHAIRLLEDEVERLKSGK